jgi:P-type Ca2+ transporter type 2C
MNRIVPEPLGLSGSEAMSRLANEGYNELPSAKPRSLWAIAWEVVREPMFLLLIGASAIYLVLGDFREALVLFASVFVVMGITFYQERKTERALEALRELSSPRAQVLRDGEWQFVPGREVVVGDLVRLNEGGRAPADAALLRASNLMADESLLTGESVPVRKRASATDPAPVRPGGDDLPFVYSGTLLTQGHGVARVMATGARTEIGKIGKALQVLVPEISDIQRETRRAVLVFAMIGLALCLLVTVLYGLRRGDWLNGLLAGITLAMANLPEEFPVVLTVFLALGAWRISQHGVLTRRAPAIETLGSTTVLCVDKTGTLTQNRMAVQRLWVPGQEEIDLQAPEYTLLPEVIEFSVLASEREPFDPMEKAYHRLAQERAPAVLEKLSAWTLTHSYPLSPEQLSVAHIWQPQGSDGYVVAAKGAPEAIAELCALDDTQRAAIHAQVAKMACDGLRVLAVARGSLSRTDENHYSWPSSQSELRLHFVGLTGLADPIRPTVPAAIRECYAAGIRTVMITGDYPGTAQAIARQIGLANPETVVAGPELDTMSDAQLRERVAQANIFARVVPEQKLRLVQAFKANGEIVAMTGDGVNDAPALKAAHIGVAMGKRGSDVAREAASLVLLEDDFASMVEAVKLGRRIFDNIQKAMCYIVAVHVPTAGMALLPLFFDWPLVFYPVHIVFLEFVIDPACSVAFEAEPPEINVMRRPPRPATSRLFNGWMIAASVLQGASVLVAVALLYALVLAAGTAEPQARAMVFAAIVIGNVGLILSNRSRQATLLETLCRPNPALWWIVGGALLGLSLALYVEPMLEIFRFAPLSWSQLLMSIAAAAVGLTWPEIYKWFRSHTVRSRRPSVRVSSN